MGVHGDVALAGNALVARRVGLHHAQGLGAFAHGADVRGLQRVAPGGAVDHGCARVAANAQRDRGARLVVAADHAGHLGGVDDVVGGHRVDRGRKGCNRVHVDVGRGPGARVTRAIDVAGVGHRDARAWRCWVVQGFEGCLVDLGVGADSQAAQDAIGGGDVLGRKELGHLAEGEGDGGALTGFDGRGAGADHQRGGGHVRLRVGEQTACAPACAGRDQHPAQQA